MRRGFTRREFTAGGLALIARPAVALEARPDATFEVWRKGAKIGSHRIASSTTEGRLLISIAAAIEVKFGPVPVLRYSHKATEIWQGERFVSLSTRSISNGLVETVEAHADETGVRIVRAKGAPLVADPRAAPLTHWNRAALQRPLFNPQTGALIHCAVRRQEGETVRYGDGRSAPATAFALSGDADIIDWYDDAGVWSALKAKAADGSWIEYRRV